MKLIVSRGGSVTQQGRELKQRVKTKKTECNPRVNPFEVLVINHLYTSGTIVKEGRLPIGKAGEMG